MRKARAPALLMTQGQYADRRGCKVRTIARAVAAGAIPVTRPGPAGRILVEEADARWAPGDVKVDGSRHRRPRGPATVGNDLSELLAADQDDDATDDDEVYEGEGKVPKAWEARLLRAQAIEREHKAEIARLKRDAINEAVIPRSDIATDGAELGAKLRAMLLALGSRLGGALSCSCRDPGEVQRLIDKESRAALVALQAGDWTHVPDVDVLVAVTLAFVRGEPLSDAVRAAVAQAAAAEPTNTDEEETIDG